ncbi:MAG TPA: hypothetical protein VJV23_02415 [Candidatus Polarisedimenticolia bacterium]|nr:hypothetical protein [Candidatus Polarisedimenticolia bacterium]
MFSRARALVLGISMVIMAASAAQAGGAWVPGRGDGDITFGYSRKRADYSWNPDGRTVANNSVHDFRYGYMNGELGFGHNLSMTYSVLYLNGYEGATENLENNRGTSELFLGLKYGLPQQGSWPMAVALNIRTSILYDQYGTYDRGLFLPDEDDLDGDGDDEEAVENGVNSEWRGLLGEDYGLKFLASRNLFDHGWLNLEIGYTYRTGNLADEVPIYAEAGFPSGWAPMYLKGAVSHVQSVGNNSETRRYDDRFGCSPNNCFPDASRTVLTGGFFFNLGPGQIWYAEAGYNHWVWGESTRKYGEPYVTLGRRF